MSAQSRHVPLQGRMIAAVVCLLLGASLTALAVQTVLGDAGIAGNVMSRGLWQRLVARFGATVQAMPDGTLLAEVALSRVFVPILIAAVVCWLAGAAWISFQSKRQFRQALARWGIAAGLWWLLPGVWDVLWTVSSVTGFAGLQSFLLAAVPMWFALAAAGWLATFLTLAGGERSEARGQKSDVRGRESGVRSQESKVRDAKPAGSAPRESMAHSPLTTQHSLLTNRVPLAVWLLAGLYLVVFTAMNWQLYFGLQVPHGDSAMYEEHLWNLTHGKGFRSYLDQGLFLGEHIQVIHLLLVPLHLIWPSHLLLELCESLALASGAVPVFWLARRHTGSARAGVLLAAAYLLYFPMHFLDIAIDLKTFRPIAFGVPALLFALDQLERGRYRTMLLFLALALAAKEDYATIIAPLGVWIALRSEVRGQNSEVRDQGSGARGQVSADRTHQVNPQSAIRNPQSAIRRHHSPLTTHQPGVRWLGTALAVFGAAYLYFVITVAIPAFRHGENVHYARYFGELGNTPGDIVVTLFERPGLVLGKLFSVRSAVYVVAMLLPAGLLPLLSPGRLAVATPLFGVMCLLELSSDPAKQGTEMLIPFHHFHAPLVPIVFWAAAAGLGNLGRVWNRFVARRRRGEPGANEAHAGGLTPPARRWAAHFAWTSALASGLFLSFAPLSLGFWDPDSPASWQSRYVPDERARLFPNVHALIPRDARVASTDLIHPRFTHHERSYDYSQYPRAVNDNKPGAPPDTDYIVIDVKGRYSEITSSGQVPEYRENPRQWELVRHDAEDYFIVLKRRWN